MVESGGMRTTTMVTRKQTSNVTAKYTPQMCIRSRVRATTTMNVADAVENPAAMMDASRAV